MRSITAIGLIIFIGYLTLLNREFFSVSYYLDFFQCENIEYQLNRFRNLEDLILQEKQIILNHVDKLKEYENELNERKSSEEISQKYQHFTYKSEEPQFSRDVFTYSSDSDENKNLIGIILNDKLLNDDSFESFFVKLHDIEIEKEKTTIAFLITDSGLAKKVKNFAKIYKSYENTFSRMVIIEADYLQIKDITYNDRVLRKDNVLNIRKFLSLNSLNNDENLMINDSNITTLLKSSFRTFINSTRNAEILEMEDDDTLLKIFGEDRLILQPELKSLESLEGGGLIIFVKVEVFSSEFVSSLL